MSAGPADHWRTYYWGQEPLRTFCRKTRTDQRVETNGTSYRCARCHEPVQTPDRTRMPSLVSPETPEVHPATPAPAPEIDFEEDLALGLAAFYDERPYFSLMVDRMQVGQRIPAGCYNPSCTTCFGGPF